MTTEATGSPSSDFPSYDGGTHVTRRVLHELTTPPSAARLAGLAATLATRAALGWLTDTGGSIKDSLAADYRSRSSERPDPNGSSMDDYVYAARLHQARHGKTK